MNIDEQAANQLINYLNSGADFVVTQAPQVAQEILNWLLFKNCAIFILAFIMFISAIIALYRKWDDWYDSELKFITGSMGVSGLIAMIISMFMIIKVLVAPKLVLLEIVSKLV